MLYLIILLAFVFFASVAMCVNEGLWSNTITLISVILSGISAILFGVPLGLLVAEKASKGDENLWYFIFALVWAVFAVTILIFRLLSEKASRVRMKFIPPLEMVAGPVMGLFVAIMFTSFAAFTLLRIPIEAGEWDLKEASGWKLQHISAPFYTVVKKYADAEEAETSIVK